MTPLEKRVRRLLAFYPPRFRKRFGEEVLSELSDLSSTDPKAARQLARDLLRNLPGTHLDDLRLRRRRSFSATQKAKEASVLDTLLRDLSFAARRLIRSPIITLVAAATLALGIGGTTAIFSVINGVLLSPLSAPAPEDLVGMTEMGPSGRYLGLSYDSFRDYQQRSESFSELAAYRPHSVSVNGGGAAPERIRGLFVSASFFTALGEMPQLGRPIAPGEDVPGGERTAVLSHGFWQRRFGADPAVIGKTLKFNNEEHTIVGVMGSSFQFPIDTTEAWISLHTNPGELNRHNRHLQAVGRLAPGVPLEQAREELSLISAALAEAYPDAYQKVTVAAAPLVENLAGGRARQLFMILVAAVSMVLLIGTANVANLQLAQATGRAREMAIRTSVGAEGRRLLIQMLVESLLLALVGGVLGVAVAYGGVHLLKAHGPGWISGRFSIAPDPGVLLFTLGVSLLTGLLFGLVPARRARRVNLLEDLQEGGRGGGPGARGHRLRAGLVIGQVALAIMLVISAGLLLRSFANLNRVEVGFDKQNLLTVQFRIPANKYETDEQVLQFFDQMLERVAAVPGVEGVASALGMPFTGDEGRVPILADGVDPGAEVEVPAIRANVVSTNYFEHMGIPLLAGRGFEAGDRAGSAQVVVISQEAARLIWPDEEDYVGRTLGLRGDERLFTVVGVVGDIYNRGMRAGLDPLVYIDYHQEPARFATIAARVAGDPHAHSQAIRQAIWQIDPDQPLWEVMTQEERIALWVGTDRFVAALLGVFALVALTLAAIGIAGVLAYSVNLRRRELGIRLSLGASRARIVQMILRHGLSLVGTGAALGFVGAFLLSRSLSQWLFGVNTFDAVIFLTAPLLLTLVALLAILGPAWRAALLDPVRTLREE